MVTAMRSDGSAGVTAVILAGGEGTRLLPLSAARAKPALPFGGQHRIIDFVLSNCRNSGISDVIVLTQYEPQELHDHLDEVAGEAARDSAGGKPLRLTVRPALPSNPYRGTAHAVLRIADAIRRSPAEVILVLAADHVYTMDLRRLVKSHLDRRADATVALTAVSSEEASRFGIVDVDPDGRIVAWHEKPSVPPGNLASMGIYAFDKVALLDWLGEQRIDFGRDLVPAMVAAGKRVLSYRFEGYWQDIGTLDSYWLANLDLLAEPSPIHLTDPTWPIVGRRGDLAEVRIGPGAIVQQSILTSGAVVHGTVERSILGPGVRVAAGAVVRDSVILRGTVIGERAVVERAIIDVGVSVGPLAHVGGPLADSNVVSPSLPATLAVVGERLIVRHGTRIPAGARVGPSHPRTDRARDIPGRASSNGPIASEVVLSSA